MKKRLMMVLVLATATPILAQPQLWGAVSDGWRNFDLGTVKCPRLEMAGSSQSGLTNVANDPASTANVLPQMRRDLEDQLADLETDLKDLEADDPGRADVQMQIRQVKNLLTNLPAAPTAAPAPKALSLEQSLKNLRLALANAAGAGSLAALEKSFEGQNAPLAARAALMALWHGKPQASLGLLLRAARLEPKNAAHLVNLSAVALYYGLNSEALSLIEVAEKLGGKLEPGVLLASKGHALLRSSQYAAAERVLRSAVAANPNLSEPRINLAYAIGMQNPTSCAEAVQWMARGQWRGNFATALENATRPLEQKFLTQDGRTPVPNSVPLVSATFNGNVIDASSAFNFIKGYVQPARFAAAKQLEQIKKVPLIATLRDHWLEGSLTETLEIGSSSIENNDLLGKSQQQRFRALSKEFAQTPSNPDATACQQAARNLEQQDAFVRAAYQTTYRTAFAALSRISEKTYRSFGQYQLIYTVYSFGQAIQKIRQDAGKLAACAVQPQLEPLAAGVMPAMPSACQAKSPSSAPKLGFALTISCDQINLNFNPPSWLPRFQITKQSVSPLEFSIFDQRLTAFSGGGFATVESEGVMVDVGGTPSAAGKDWRYVFDASKAAPVWFLSVENGSTK